MKTEEPEVVLDAGEPAKTEVAVLGADEPKRTLGWTVREYLGSEIYKRASDGSVNLTPLTAQEDIQEGIEVLVPWLSGGYMPMTVAIDDDGGFFGRGGSCIAAFEFDTDDRHCWTCGGIINTKGLRKLELHGD